MSYSGYPFELIDYYIKYDKHFNIDDDFLINYILYIIDYFYVKDINITDAVYLDNICKYLECNYQQITNVHFNTVSDIHEFLKHKACIVNCANKNEIFNENIYKYIPRKDPFDIIVYILKSINISYTARDVDYYHYFITFGYMIDTGIYFRRNIFPKLVEDISILNNDELRRLFACILEDVTQNVYPNDIDNIYMRVYTKTRPELYKYFPVELLEKYRINNDVINKYFHDNEGLHINLHSYRVDIYYQHLENEVIINLKSIIEKHLDNFIKYTNVLDADLCAMIITNHFDRILQKLSIYDKYSIYGSYDFEESITIDVIDRIIYKLWYNIREELGV